MLTNLFISLGWSRDDWKWLWLQLSTVAALIVSNVFDVSYWCGQLGIPLSPTALHWISALAALVLWIAGRYNSSPLPSAQAMASGAVPGSPVDVKRGAILPVVLLAVALGAGSLSLPACAKAPPTLSPSGQAAFNALRVGHALDIIRDTANDANHQTPPLISRADLLLVVNWHESAVKTIVAVPGGWKPTVLASLDELKNHVSPAAWQKIALYVSLAKTVIAEIP